MDGDLLVYGSYGYTGSLIAQEAVERGLSPILAGRDPSRVESQATDLGCDHRVFSLEHPTVVEDHVAAADVVLNCAGPFSVTANPLVEACLTAGTDYLDLAGSIQVLEWIAERDRDAEKADVTLLPAVGFEVVPTDCLAAFLDAELPSATQLTLAIDGIGPLSPGTVKSVIEGASLPGAVRTSGELRSVPAAWRTREIDFGRGRKTAVSIPWADVSLAYYSTGIPDIETYAAVPKPAITAMRWGTPLLSVLGIGVVKRLMFGGTDLLVSGPTAAERAGTVTRLWGEVRDDDGNRVVARMRTPNMYDVTARAAVETARRVLGGDVSSGFQTPASAFGPDFIHDIPGIDRELVGVRAVA